VPKAGESVCEKDLKKPFALCFTSDEEVGCLGARKLLREKVHLGKYVLIGEPTEMIPLNLHKGYMFIRIVLRGKTGHASTPSKGRSVIHLALSLVLQKIDKFKHVLEEVKDARFNPDHPTVN
jgi:acetylornithine deacetylase